jgi:hypothetical protein
MAPSTDRDAASRSILSFSASLAVHDSPTIASPVAATIAPLFGMRQLHNLNIECEQRHGIPLVLDNTIS